jgi:hypothetical protein
MNSQRGCIKTHIVFSVALAVRIVAEAQVTTINSAAVSPRVYNDVPSATLTVVTNYPSLISFTEENVFSATGFANRDVWHFSADGGQSAFQFQSNDYFQASITLTLVGNPITPRKEAGFVFNNPLNDGGEFILDTDGHEVVAFGGFLPFYAFPKFFNSGDTVTLGITYFRDENGKNAIIYSANGTNSPPLEFSNTEQGVINNTTIGGYFQIEKDSTNMTNSGSATFRSINITPPSELGIAALPGSAHEVVVFWSAALTNYVLQSTTDITSTNWVTVTNGNPIIGMTVSNTAPATYYRLVAP